MPKFDISETTLKGAFLITPFFAGDNRGEFVKNFERDIYKEAGIEFCINETFLSKSAKNVIRGLHFQIRHPQAKLVSVVRGRVWDVIVDLRPDSATYKKWLSFELSEENHRCVLVPRGFAHGFVSLEDDTVMLYQCDGKYDSETDTGIIYNDAEIGIDWPVDDTVAIHSARDLTLKSFKDYLLNPMEL